MEARTHWTLAVGMSISLLRRDVPQPARQLVLTARGVPGGYVALR